MIMSGIGTTKLLKIGRGILKKKKDTKRRKIL